MQCSVGGGVVAGLPTEKDILEVESSAEVMGCGWDNNDTRREVEMNDTVSSN